MGQTTEVELPIRAYTRSDFTALRAWLQRTSIENVARLYYDDEAPQVVGGLERFLVAMREDLINRAVVANPMLAAGLANARKVGQINPGILDVLVKAADLKPRPPRLADPIGQHLRPKVASALKDDGQKTLSDLVERIKSRGPGWWRAIPRIGAGRARTIEKWLAKHALLAHSELEVSMKGHGENLVPLTRTPLPIERIATLPAQLSGQVGRNRGRDFCYLQATNDLEALQSYLMRFGDQPHTLRAYTKELERFLLWCILVRKVALSDVLVDDCEAYKTALASPPHELTGLKAPRLSGRWKPFTGSLSLSSQKQAITILRSAFEWLVSVRYLGGNPWVAVKSPKAEKQLTSIQIRKAMPESTFEKLIEVLDKKCEEPEATQFRVARAAIFLMGEAGLRRSEAVTCTRNNIREATNLNVKVIDVLGKGKKWRTVPLSKRTMTALEAHWSDFTSTPDSSPLLRPLRLPATSSSVVKHGDSTGGYSAGGLATMVTTSIARLAADSSFSVDELIKLRTISAHGLRHTFGTKMAAKGMPLDVLQMVMGHASLDTTSIYVQAEERRMADEAAKAFSN